ncbi:MAG: hypothetical protein Q8L54_13260 [Devosia sp.]|nr:hypothetical protein [Devosia sp.]
MTIVKHLAVASIALFAAAPGLAVAGSIKDQVPDAELAAYCSKAGAGTETMASLQLPDGTTLTGSIHCEAEDLVAGDDDDDDDAVDDDEDDDDDEADDGDDGDSGDDDSDDDSEDSDDDD